MAEYINRDLFAREVNRLSTTPFNEWDTMGILLLLDTIPTADVKPVVHGHWIVRRGNYNEEFECSKCRHISKDGGNYCSNCGARMEGRR